MKKTYKGIRAKLWFLLLLAVLFLPVRVSAAAASEGVVAIAQANRVSGGRWLTKKEGISYRRKNGDFLKNGWYLINSQIYCFDSSGFVRTGSFSYQGNRYYADQKGRIYVDRWRKSGKKTYYYDKNGAQMKRGWRTINGNLYYFDRQRSLVTSSWVTNQYVGADGILVRSATVDGRQIDEYGVVKTLSSRDKYIFVGASRTVDISLAVNSTDAVFIAKGGTGYNWLKNVSGPMLISYLNDNPYLKVIVVLGNNDLENCDLYIRYYRQLIRRFPETEFYFMDVMPEDGKRKDKNALRKQFNSTLRREFGQACIGGYSYLKEIGYTTVDGTHYPEWVSREIYRYAIRKVKDRPGAQAPTVSF